MDVPFFFFYTLAIASASDIPTDTLVVLAEFQKKCSMAAHFRAASRLTLNLIIYPSNTSGFCLRQTLPVKRLRLALRCTAGVA